MSYIGKEPIVGNFQKCDAITTSSTATYNLTVGSVAVFPETTNNCIVSLNGVVQAPTSAYTISGSQIIFNSSLTSSDVIDFILILGSVLSVGTPTDNTVSTAKIVDVNVTTAKIADDAITLAKMAPGTDGNLITYDASGNPAAVATGSSGQFLKSQGAGNVPIFAAASGAAVLTATQTDGPTARQSFTSTSFFQPTTNLKVTITPQSTDSKFLLIIGSGMIRLGICTIFRDSTNLGDATHGLVENPDDFNPIGIAYLDSPSTTSEIVYSFQVKLTESGTGYVNNNGEHFHMQCIEIDVS